MRIDRIASILQTLNINLTLLKQITLELKKNLVFKLKYTDFSRFFKILISAEMFLFLMNNKRRQIYSVSFIFFALLFQICYIYNIAKRKILIKRLTLACNCV